MGWTRILFMTLTIIIGVIVLTVFLNLFLKLAAFLFLIAFAYYWLMKAIRLRKDNRHW